MPKRRVGRGRTAKQKAASRMNLEAARKKKMRQGNSLLAMANGGDARLRGRRVTKADKYFRKADVFEDILAGKKPKGKKAMQRIYGKR